MKEEIPVLLKAPPRLLLGVAFLFWGAMHDQAVPALLAAIAMEGRNWTKMRWDFGLKGFARSWQLSMLVLIASSISLVRVEQVTSADFLSLLTWLPFMMLPLGLAQQYARQAGVPTITFSFIARRKMESDRRAGRTVEMTAVRLGYPYFVLILIGAGMGVGNLGQPGPVELRYAGGVVLLVGWAFFGMEGRRERPWAWLLGYTMALVMTALLYAGFAYAYQYFLKGVGGSERQGSSAFETQTSLGQVQRLQLSPRILWRYDQEKGSVPRLLQIASYNVPYLNYWQAGPRKKELAEQIDQDRAAGGDFEKLVPLDDETFVYQDSGRDAGDYSQVGRLVGLISEQALVPHAAKTTRFEGIPAEILTVNSLGAFQLNGVKQGAMEVRLYSDPGEQSVELDPTEEDLVVLKGEEEGLRRFLRGMGFQVPDDAAEKPGSQRRRVPVVTPRPSVTPAKFREIEGRLAGTFQESFDYSLLLTGTSLRAPITEFLEETRSGHCEYFAGATAMLLRRLGIPTRYVVGFAVQEQGGDREWILRGQHAHAWAQAYVGGKWVNEGSIETPVWRCRGGEWVNVDLTPTDWSAVGSTRGWSQWFSDLFQKWRANLVLWSSRSSVVSRLEFLIGGIALAGLVFLGYRLFTTRAREGGRAKGSWEERVALQGALRDFERWLGKRVGPRPPGLPMGTWLLRSLPIRGAEVVDWYERATYRDGTMDEKELREIFKDVRSHWRDHQKNPGAKKTAGLE